MPETKLEYARRKLKESEKNLQHFHNWRAGQFWQSRVETYAEMVSELEREKEEKLSYVTVTAVTLADLQSVLTLKREIGTPEQIQEAQEKYDNCKTVYDKMVAEYEQEWRDEEKSESTTA